MAANRDVKQLSPHIFEKICEIIHKESDISIEQLDWDTDFKNDIGLDSMQLLRIASTIEEQLAIELPAGIMEVNTLIGFFEVLTKELDKKNGAAH